MTVPLSPTRCSPALQERRAIAVAIGAPSAFALSCGATGRGHRCWVVIFPRSVMSNEVPVPDDSVSPEEAAAFARLRKSEAKEIDNAILSCATPHWQKVARVVTL